MAGNQTLQVDNPGTLHPAAAAITQILEDQARGWNQGDAKLYAAAFAEDGSFTNIFGMFFTGHAEFLRRHDMILQTVFKNSHFSYELTQLKVLNESTVLAETLITVANFHKTGIFEKIYTDKEGRMFTRLLQVFVKDASGWKIVSYHNVDMKEGFSAAAIPAQVATQTINKTQADDLS